MNEQVPNWYMKTGQAMPPTKPAHAGITERRAP